MPCLSLSKKLYAEKTHQGTSKNAAWNSFAYKKLYAYNRKTNFAIAIPATFAKMSLRAAWQKFMAS